MRPGQDVRERCTAPSAFVTVSRVRFVSLLTARDRRAGHRRALRILHNAREAAVKNLRVCGDRDEREARNGQ